MGVITGTNQEPGLDLLKDPDSKIGGGGVIHWDGNDSAICATQKCRDPSRRIRAPDYDAIAFANATRGKFASETEREPGYLAVSPAYKPVSDTFGIGLLTAKPIKVGQIIGNAGSHLLSVNHRRRAEWFWMQLAPLHEMSNASQRLRRCSFAHRKVLDGFLSLCGLATFIPCEIDSSCQQCD